MVSGVVSGAETGLAREPESWFLALLWPIVHVCLAHGASTSAWAFKIRGKSAPLLTVADHGALISGRYNLGQVSPDGTWCAGSTELTSTKCIRTRLDTVLRPGLPPQLGSLEFSDGLCLRSHSSSSPREGR